MRLGISSYAFAWAVGVAGSEPRDPLGPEELIDRAVDLGVDLVQFADNLDFARWSVARVDGLAAQAAERGVDIEVAARGIGPGLGWALELSERFRAPFVRVVIDSAGDHPSPRQALQRLRGWEAEFRRAGKMLAIENHDRFTTRELSELVERLGSWSGICLDTVNSFGVLQGPEEVVRALAPLAVNVHVKDFTIERHPHQMGFEIVGTVAGEGRLDIPFVVAQANRFGARTAALELWTPPEARLEDTIRKEEEWVRRSIRYLTGVRGLELRPASSVDTADAGMPSYQQT